MTSFTAPLPPRSSVLTTLILQLSNSNAILAVIDLCQDLLKLIIKQRPGHGEIWAQTWMGEYSVSCLAIDLAEMAIEGCQDGLFFLCYLHKLPCHVGVLIQWVHVSEDVVQNVLLQRQYWQELEQFSSQTLHNELLHLLAVSHELINFLLYNPPCILAPVGDISLLLKKKVRFSTKT